MSVLVLLTIVENGDTLPEKNKTSSGIPIFLTTTSPVLPNIPYNKGEIQEVIDELPIASEIRNQVDTYIKNIEEKVVEVQKYQSKSKPENFYQPMRTALLDIKNNLNAIYDLTKPYHSTLPNTLKQLIIGWITPLDIELEKLIIPPAEKEISALKTKYLYAEQSFLARQPHLQKSLMQHLEGLKNLLKKSGQPAPTCYISYAWPSKENQEQEYWVQPFLFVLYDHLTQAGIRVVMDIRDNKPGDSIYQFMKNYHDGNHVILVGTESLLQKHYSIKAHKVQTELSILLDRGERDQKQFGYSRVYPMLLSGTLKTSYPERFDGYSTVRDARESGYIGTLKKLIDWVYETRIKKFESQYSSAWKAFNEKYQGLPRDLKSIEGETSLGYHRKRLDYLRQDIQYQTVEAQEKNEHSPAVTTKIIGALIESQGNNPKTLFDEHGQQFQRPSITLDFIERQELWGKITKHFAQSEQQILTLTAHGLGGVGKTTLAQEYYLHPPRPYTLRAWFNAENKEQLYNQYLELASASSIRFTEDLPIEQRITRIKNWLEQQKDCLLVYDNVPSIKTIEELLPKQGKHHILITSRNSVDWPQHQKLDMDVMEEAEAIALICKITGSHEKDEKLRELVDVLGYLPLAMAQAGAYMAEKQTSIDDYLNLYRRHQSTLMKDETLTRNPKHEPVWITFDMNFKALEVNCPAALTTLKQASWLNASKIPEELLRITMKNVNGQPRDLLWGDVKKYIRRYSLMRIDSENYELSIHRLLQNIIRNQQTAAEKISTFKQLCKGIDDLYRVVFPEKFKLLEIDVQQRALLPHFQMLLEHYSTLKDENKDKASEQARYYLLKIIGTDFTKLAKYDEAIKYFEQAKSLLKLVNDKREIVKLNYLYGWSESNRLVDLKLAWSLLKEAAEAVKNHRDDLLAPIYHEMGVIRLNQGIWIEAAELLETAKGYLDSYRTEHMLGRLFLERLDIHQYDSAQAYLASALAMHGVDKEDRDKAVIIADIGRTYFLQGNLSEAKQYLLRALKMAEKIYGKDALHNDIADYNLYLGWVLYDVKKSKESNRQAREYVEKAAKIDRQVFASNPNHPRIVRDNLILKVMENGNNLPQHWRDAYVLQSGNTTAARQGERSEGAEYEILSCLSTLILPFLNLKYG